MGLLAFLMPVRRVVMVSIIGGNMFLPVAGIALPGMPNYTKPVAAGLGAFFAALLVATPQLLSWRPKVMDLFMGAFLIAPFFSSMINGLGAWDACSATGNRFLEWGVAYWVGRTLFRDDEAIRELAIGIVIGGMLYAPLCLWESVMSPQLHRQVYGFRPSSFVMAKRWGGWRPMVFMPHGLAVAVWMASTAMVAWILWRSRAVLIVWGMPMRWVALGLVAVTVGLRSTGAVILLVGLILAAEIVQASRWRVALLALVLLPAGYIGLRVAGWNGSQLVSWTNALGEERSGSLQMRLANDSLIVERAMERPVFGWGGWGRWRVRDDLGRDITVSDSWWAILLGSTGLVGLIGAYGAFLSPAFLLIRQRTRSKLFGIGNGAAWSICLALLLFVLDTLANAMPNTSYMLAAGAMAAYVLRTRNMNGPELAAVADLRDGIRRGVKPTYVDLR